MIDYTATKGANDGFTRALAKNVVKQGIRVNAVLPAEFGRRYCGKFFIRPSRCIWSI